MKKITLTFLFVCFVSSIYAQTPPAEVTFEGKLESIQTHILPQVFTYPDGMTSEIVKYELTFGHELNPATKLKISVIYDHRTIVGVTTETGGGSWKMKVGKIYYFKLSKVCTNVQYLGTSTLYNAISVPQTTDCSKMVLKTDNITRPDDYVWNDLVVHEGHLYRFKMVYTNKNSELLERGGFRD
jgi:hypothetical protein